MLQSNFKQGKPVLCTEDGCKQPMTFMTTLRIPQEPENIAVVFACPKEHHRFFDEPRETFAKLSFEPAN